MKIQEQIKHGGVYVLPVLVFIVAYLLTDQIWQDYLLLFATLLIAVTLVPTLLNPDSVIPRSTSVPAAFAVLLFVVGTGALDLWLTAAANIVSFLMWSLVVVYRSP